MARSDEFELYDLKVSVEAIAGNCTCAMQVGDCFFLRGGKLALPDGRDFCLYALQAAIPLLPAKQRPLSPNDWMATDAVIACPDPNCGGRFRITRGELRTYRHSEQTVTPLVKP